MFRHESTVGINIILYNKKAFSNLVEEKKNTKLKTCFINNRGL